MKIAVVGSSSLLGEGMTSIITGTDSSIIATHHKLQVYKNSVPLDITDKRQVITFIHNYRPDALINLAAITNLEMCDNDPSSAYATNVMGPVNLAEACNRERIHFVHVSTDYVFDGDHGPYTESDVPSPISFYGRTKLEAEQRVLQIDSSFCIARTAMLYGWSSIKGNLAKDLIYNLRKGRKMDIVSDQFVSPSYNRNIAEMLIEISERRIDGIIHTAGASVMSRYDFALAVTDHFKLDSSLIQKVSIFDFQWKAKRPIKGGLIVDKAKKMLASKPLSVHDALERMVKDEQMFY